MPGPGPGLAPGSVQQVPQALVQVQVQTVEEAATTAWRLARCRGDECRQSARLGVLERDGRLCDAVIPDAEPDVRLVAVIARDAKRSSRVARVGAEELDELAALQCGTPRAEAVARFDRPPTATAGGHHPEPMPAGPPWQSRDPQTRRGGSRRPARLP